MVEESERKDREKMERALASIKSSLDNKRSPSINDLATIKFLAAKNPGNDELKQLAEAAETTFLSAQTAASTGNVEHLMSTTSIYSEEEYKNLLRKEREYFNDPENQKIFKFIDKIDSGARIDDNDPTGESLTTKEFVEIISKVTDEKEKKKRKEVGELPAHECKKFDQKRQAKKPLTMEEVERECEIREANLIRLHQELFEAKYKHHRHNIAQEEERESVDISIEYVVHKKGNIIIDDVKQTHAKITEKLTTVELAALLFHNPEAFHRHHDDVDRLRDAAVSATQTHVDFEKRKLAANKERIVREDRVTVAERSAEVQQSERAQAAKVAQSSTSIQEKKKNNQKNDFLAKLAAQKSKKPTKEVFSDSDKKPTNLSVSHHSIPNNKRTPDDERSH